MPPHKKNYRHPWSSRKKKMFLIRSNMTNEKLMLHHELECELYDNHNLSLHLCCSHYRHHKCKKQSKENLST